MQNIVRTVDTPDGGQIVFNIVRVPSLDGALYLASASGGFGGQHFFHLKKTGDSWNISQIISGADWIFNYEEELGKAIEEMGK
jgi:hypothetical protein